jgi:hypothetical protein
MNPSRKSRGIQPSKAMSDPKDESFPEIERNSALEGDDWAER